MKTCELKDKIDILAPFSISEELKKQGYYDNSGIICEGEGDKILAVLDLTDSAINFAIKNKCNLILTHHPAIFMPVTSITGLIAKCIKNNIGVVSAHLNADYAKNGVDYYFAKLLGAEDAKVLDVQTFGGYGRLFNVKKQTLQEYVNFVKEKLNCKNVCVFGKDNVIVEKVATFCGAGLDENNLFLSQSANVLVSADIKHHILLQATEQGKCVIMPTHFATENKPFKLFCKDLESKFKLNIMYYEQDTLI